VVAQKLLGFFGVPNIEYGHVTGTTATKQGSEADYFDLCRK
jgi:hypothetical protein